MSGSRASTNLELGIISVENMIVLQKIALHQKKEER